MYNWLDQQGDPFFEHFKVIHAKGEFSRRGAGGELISTNGVEGVFSRMKRLLRGYRASPSDASQYGDYLGEFLWRMRFVRSEGESWRRSAFWHVLKVLKWKYKPNFVDPNRRWAPPPELQAEVDALQAAAALPRARRPGGRFGKRPRTLAIEDGQVEEVESTFLSWQLRTNGLTCQCCWPHLASDSVSHEYPLLPKRLNPTTLNFSHLSKW